MHFLQCKNLLTRFWCSYKLCWA